jgi:hypothetical protein
VANPVLREGKTKRQKAKGEKFGRPTREKNFFFTFDFCLLPFIFPPCMMVCKKIRGGFERV